MNMGISELGEARCTESVLAVELDPTQVKKESDQAERMPPEAPLASAQTKLLRRRGRKE
jgi:hypothetical protein